MVILDTREPCEYKVSHIRNAINVGCKTFSMDSVKNIAKGAKVVVYCSVGYRSKQIGEILVKNGYSNVFNLQGGIFKWVNDDFPIVDMNNHQTDRIHAYSKLWGKWLKKGVKVYGN